jgi:hypothetical protein
VSVATFFRWSLAMPLVLPLLVLPLGLARNEVGGLGFLLLMSLVFGGVPYLVFAALLLWWSRGKSEAQLRRAGLLAPVLMLPVYWLCLILDTAITRQIVRDPADLGNLMFTLSLFILTFGYAYVILAMAMLALFTRLGWVRR